MNINFVYYYYYLFIQSNKYVNYDTGWTGQNMHLKGDFRLNVFKTSYCYATLNVWYMVVYQT